MKTSAYLFALLLAIAGLQACTPSADKRKDTIQNVRKNDSIGSISNDDAEFLKRSARGSIMEVELGRLAQANSSNGRVKNFGNMMIADHGKAKEQLGKMASSKELVLPETLDADHQKHIDRLKDRKGPAFDLTYIDIMIKDHKEDIRKFKKAGKDAMDPGIKSFAMKTLPVLQKHLDSAKAIQKLLKPALDNMPVP